MSDDSQLGPPTMGDHEDAARREAAYPQGPLASRRAPNPDPLDPSTTAADYTLAALGVERAALLVAALTAGWLSDDERAALRPLAAAVAYLAGLEAPA